MIFGERNSGTNYLEQLFLKNFNMKYENMIVWKHWMGFKEKPTEGTENILSIGIVRDPIDWLSSMKNLAPHAEFLSDLDWDGFLKSEWYSMYQDKELMIDRNYHTNERYKNILELRKTKLNWLKNPDIPGPYALVRYEDLVKDPEAIITQLSSEFNLENKKFVPIKKDAKHIHAGDYKKKEYQRPPGNLMNFIRENLDLNLEKELGYDC